MLYEKSNRLPPAGSIREAVLISVWLRRQEMEVAKTRTIVLGLMEIAVESKDVKGSQGAFKQFVDAAFPFAAKERGKLDEKMVEVMKKEAEKGPVLFNPVILNNRHLKKAVKRLKAPDSYKKELQSRATRSRTRR